MAIMWMAHGLMPVGIIPISWLAEVASIDIALLVSAFLLAATMALLGFFYPELKTIDRGHGAEDSVPDTHAPGVSIQEAR